MDDWNSFAVMIVSQLGTPYEPFRLSDVPGLIAIALAVAAWFAVEGGLGPFVVWLFRRIRNAPEDKPPGQ